MIFLVSFEKPGSGLYQLGTVEVEEKETSKQTKQAAQRKVVEMLVEAGIPRDVIGIISDHISLEVGIHKVSIVPVKEFNSRKASALAALL